MAYSLTLGTLSFLFSVIWGGPLIRLLKRYEIGELIRVDGPRSHFTKMGTPTMGGIMILVPVLLITVALNLSGRLSMLLPIGVIVSCGILGAVDDLSGIVRRRRNSNPDGSFVPEETIGLLARYKFFWQLVIATAAALAMFFLLGLRSIAIPMVTEKLEIGLWYLPVAIFIILGTSNAVNLSDGLDGLAGGMAAIAFAAYGIIAFLQGQAFLVTFCFTVVGAVLAFLWYNAYPAQLFMGDTGSLPLGATLAVVALMTGQWLLLPIVGLVFVADTVSVILQVGYFKLTGGKRIFKMAPLHHHFELLGWSEVQVVQRFWLLAMLSAMLGVALALL